MKIVYVNSLFGKNAIGGAEKITYILAKAMLDRGHEVFVVSLHYEKNIEMDIFDGIKVIYLPLKNFYWISDRKKNKLVKFLWHILDAWNPFMLDDMSILLGLIKPDIVHYHNISGFSASVIGVSDKKRVITLHDYYFKCYRSAMYRDGEVCAGQCRDCKILTLPRKLISSEVDYVIPVSDFLGNEVCSDGYFLTSQKVVIKNVIEKKIDGEVGKLSKKRVVRFGYIGRLSEEKGFLSLLSIFERISHNREDYELVIAGDGDLRDLIGKHSERTVYRGVINSDEFFDDIDILLVPSIWNDPYPTVILEAHSVGIPVLGRRRGGITEMLIEYGDRWLFDSDQEMYERIIEILDGKLAIERISSEGMTIHDWASKYEDVYKQ